jgi:hypothetical protein
VDIATDCEDISEGDKGGNRFEVMVNELSIALGAEKRRPDAESESERG